MEILRQAHGDDIDAIFVPIGGGGLIAGIAAYAKSLYPRIKIIGVEPEDAAGMYESLRAGKRVTLDRVGIFADGVAVQARRRGDLPARAAVRRRDSARDDRSDLRRDPGHLRGYALDRRAGGRARGRRHQEIRGARGLHGAHLGGDQRRREHELRPAALRRRARRHRRPARGPARGARFRRNPARSCDSARSSAGAASPNSTTATPTTRPRSCSSVSPSRRARAERESLIKTIASGRLHRPRHDRQRDGEAACAIHGRRTCRTACGTNGCSASNFPSDRARF